MNQLKNNYDLIVSIVLYRPEIRLLQQTLDSCSQTSLKIKVVLFDNSRTPFDVSQVRCTQELEYVFNGKNIGYGSGHNRNIKKYLDQGKYFLILNPDIFFEGDLLTALFKRMELDSSIGVCIPKICHPSGDVQMVNRRIPRPQDYLISFLNSKFKTQMFKTQRYSEYLLENFDTEIPFICPIISGCFMFFRSKALAEVGGFDERYFLYLEDTDLSRRVSESHKVVVFSDLTAFHHWSRGAYKSVKLFSMFVRNMIRYFDKWGWFFDPKRDRLNAQVAPYVLSAPAPSAEPSSALNPPHIFDTVN